MRNFIILLLLLSPGTARSMEFVSSIERTNIQLTFPREQTSVKQVWLKKIVQKRLLKHTAAYGDSDGKGLAIAGFTIGLLGVLSCVIPPFIGFYLLYPLILLGLVGLALSIFGLIKAMRWRGTGWIKGLAIAGIVLNAVLSVGLALLIALLSS